MATLDRTFQKGAVLCWPTKPVSIMLMTNTIIAVFLGIIGAALGSFAGAVAWRLHEKRNFVSERSECESCHHKLSVFDLIPVLSWLLLRSKCRYCGAKIGAETLLSESALSALFVISYLYWPYGVIEWQAIAMLAVWLIALVLLAILVVYDARWLLLPDAVVFPLIALGFLFAALYTSLQPGMTIPGAILYMGFGMVSLAGVYGILYLVSKGKWVGFGDVKLSIFIGLVVGWQKALLVLFLANIIGFLIVLPGLLTHKLTRTSRVPFGPFLIVAFILAGLFGDEIIKGYIRLIGL